MRARSPSREGRSRGGKGEKGVRESFIDETEVGGGILDGSSKRRSLFGQSPGDRYLLLLANTGYIGQYSLQVACYNGQTPIAHAIDTG